jgi:hypothetical protein
MSSRAQTDKAYPRSAAFLSFCLQKPRAATFLHYSTQSVVQAVTVTYIKWKINIYKVQGALITNMPKNVSRLKKFRKRSKQRIVPKYEWPVQSLWMTNLFQISSPFHKISHSKLCII